MKGLIGINNNSQIFILCLVGLKPDFLSFSVYSVLEVIVFYYYSKEFLYYNAIKSSNKS